MDRTDLRDDPRFKTNADRVAHLDETDALVGAWTRTLGSGSVGEPSSESSANPLFFKSMAPFTRHGGWPAYL